MVYNFFRREMIPLLDFRRVITIISILMIFACNKDSVNSATTTNELSVSQKETLIGLVNKVRKEGCNCGNTAMPPVSPLTWNQKLENAALLHSEDMYENNYFDHVDKQGVDPSIRITNAGYIWASCGENIARGPQSVEEVMNGWLNSEVHCKNLMNKDFKDLGVGRVSTLWTQNFGNPR
jgi:uncharacterized protein YkwD